MTLEELLNKCIQKGWKPRGKEETKRLNYNTLYREVVSLEFDNYNLETSYSIRDLVSKSSGLWQFCVENGMINTNDTPEENAINYWRYNKKDLTEWWYMRNYQYRLIESSLKDESEIESFILENIKVDEKYTEEEQELIDLDYGTGYTKKFVK